MSPSRMGVASKEDSSLVGRLLIEGVGMVFPDGLECVEVGAGDLGGGGETLAAGVAAVGGPGLSRGEGGDGEEEGEEGSRHGVSVLGGHSVWDEGILGLVTWWRWYRTGMQVIVEIPDEFVEALAPQGEDAARKMLEDHTAQAYREGKLTMFEVQQILGLPTRMHVDPFLLKYEIYDYTVEMLEKDFETLERLRA